jgi:hypothetical protein
MRDGVAAAISRPTLVCDAEGDLFFKGQPQELYDRLTCPKTMIVFTEAEGAGAHCQVGASRLAFARIYDWLDETLARDASGGAPRGKSPPSAVLKAFQVGAKHVGDSVGIGFDLSGGSRTFREMLAHCAERPCDQIAGHCARRF